MEGIESPRYPRSKPEEYYEALRKVAKAVSQFPDDPATAWEIAKPELAKALGLAPEESVSASLRSYQILNRVPDEKLDALSRQIGDDAMRYAYAHDTAIRQLARFAGLREGTNPTPFDQELASAENQGKLGNTALWERLVSRVLDDASSKHQSGEPMGEDITKFAESAAAFPEQQDWMTDQQKRSLSRRSGYADRVRMIERMLLARAKGRAKTDAERRKKLAKETGVDLDR
jgi:hypothetical protein